MEHLFESLDHYYQIAGGKSCDAYCAHRCSNQCYDSCANGCGSDCSCGCGKFLEN